MIGVKKIFNVGDDTLGCNSFLINAGEGWYLIDTSLPTSSKKLVDNIKNYGIKRLNGVLLTHEHLDHIGSSRAVQKTFNSPIYATKKTIDIIYYYKEPYIGSWLFSEPYNPPEKIKEITEGAFILPGGWTVEIFYLSGHSLGSMVIFDKTTKSLFSGDLLFTGGMVGRWDLPGGNLKDLCESLQFLKNIPFDNLYPGHGSLGIKDGIYHLNLALSLMSNLC